MLLTGRLLLLAEAKRKQKGEKEHEESRSKAQIAESRARIDKIKVCTSLPRGAGQHCSRCLHPASRTDDGRPRCDQGEDNG